MLIKNIELFIKVFVFKYLRLNYVYYQNTLFSFINNKKYTLNYNIKIVIRNLVYSFSKKILFVHVGLTRAIIVK